MSIRFAISILVNLLVVDNSLSNHKLMSWVRSPRITQWGKWGHPEFCPNNSWVGGMRLKIDTSQGWRDDTALNAVQLHCITMNWIHTVSITSATGPWGNYRKNKYCPQGLATGYQLRSENKVATDDVGAVDFKLKCTNFDGSTSYVINSEIALPWGTWSSEQNCPSKTAVCGIITQVEPDDQDEDGKFNDETSLNNVDLACCKIPDPAQACHLKTSWETIIVCPKAKKKCEVKITTGFTEDKKLTKFAIRFYEKLGFIVDFRFAKKVFKLRAENDKTLLINGKPLAGIIGETQISKNTTTIQLNCEGISQQLVIICGSYKVHTNEYRCVPDGDQGSNYGVGLYFQPSSVAENIIWSYNCDFGGGNIKSEESLSENCGDLCLRDKQCTHFTWTKEGTCWLKGTGVSLSPTEKYDEGMVCGWIERV